MKFKREANEFMWHVPTYTPVINWRNKKNKTGLYVVHIRVTIYRESRYIPIRVPGKARLNHWNGKDRQWLKLTHPYAFEINEEIDKKMASLYNLNRRFFQARKQLTFSQIFQELKQDYNPKIFNDFFEIILKNPPEAISSTNLKRYYAAKSAFNKFNDSVAFYELDEPFFQRLKKFLTEKGNLDASTIRGYFNAYKKVLKWSRYNAHISKEKEKEALEGITHRGADTKDNDFLELHEAVEWQNFVLPESLAKHQRHQDMFLLLIYTGYYYSDLKELLKTELRQDTEFGWYLRSNRYKNDNLAIVPLWKFPRVMEIINDYRDDDKDSPYLLKRDAFIRDQPFNRILKKIAGPKGLGWQRDIYNKLGRKTNAQLYIRFGAGVPQVGKMLGHEEGSSATNNYFNINLLEIVEATRSIDFGKLGLGVGYPVD